MDVEKYLEQLKQEWSSNGIDAEKMMESLKLQWEAMGIDPAKMMIQMQETANELSQDIENSELDEDTMFEDLPNPMTDWEGDALLFNSKDGAEIQLLKSLSCGAHLTVINGSFLNSVSTGMSKEEAQLLLSSYWEINSKDSFLETIAMLFIAGHQDAWEQISEVLTNHPVEIWEEAYEDLLEEILTDEADREEIEENLQNIIETWPYMNDFVSLQMNDTIAVYAWDYCRAINVCRWAYDAGFCSLQEAENWIEQASELLFETYESWEELSIGYIVGHAMWNSDLELLNDSLHAHYLLTSQSKSPWQLLDWK